MDTNLLSVHSYSTVNHSERDIFDDSQARSGIMSNFKSYFNISFGFFGMSLNRSMCYLFSVLVLVMLTITYFSAVPHCLYIDLTFFSHMQLIILLYKYKICVIFITITVIVIVKAINNYINHYFSFLLVLLQICNNSIMINDKSLQNYLNTDYYIVLILIFSWIGNESIMVYYDKTINIYLNTNLAPQLGFLLIRNKLIAKSDKSISNYSIVNVAFILVFLIISNVSFCAGTLHNDFILFVAVCYFEEHICFSLFIYSLTQNIYIEHAHINPMQYSPHKKIHDNILLFNHFYCYYIVIFISETRHQVLFIPSTTKICSEPIIGILVITFNVSTDTNNIMYNLVIIKINYG